MSRIGDAAAGALVVLDPTSGTPPSEQVRVQLTAAIDSGRLSPAVRLPTVRSLAAELGLAVNTVARAYRELERQGLIATQGRHGTFVAGASSVARAQAAIEARAFLTRMRVLGVGEAEMVAILRRQAELLADGDGDGSAGA
jgi:DNA-binding transcriptional regulator YhcF (GntR family)